MVALVSQRTGFESLVCPAGLLAAHTTAGLSPQLLVRAAPGIDAAALTTNLSVIGIAVVLALFASLMPARAATRTRPIDAAAVGE